MNENESKFRTVTPEQLELERECNEAEHLRDLMDMKVGETYSLNGDNYRMNVIRVIGGWIHTVIVFDRTGVLKPQSVFVPDGKDAK